MNTKPFKGFTIVELLVVVDILVVISGAVVGLISDAPDQARRQFTTDSMIKLKTALLDFRDDMGDFPDEGVLLLDPSQPDSNSRLTPQGIDVRQSLNNTTGLPAYLIGSIANPNNGLTSETNHRTWSRTIPSLSAPASVKKITSNFWMLFRRPIPEDWGTFTFPDSTVAYTHDPNLFRFSKSSKLGWEGPYINDGRNAFFYPPSSNFGNQFSITDQFTDTQFSESWLKPEDGGLNVASRRLSLGSPILFVRDEDEGYYLLSAGPNGIYDFLTEDDDRDNNDIPDGDDIKVFVSPL